jgi:hypothetical protein
MLRRLRKLWRRILSRRKGEQKAQLSKRLTTRDQMQKTEEVPTQQPDGSQQPLITESLATSSNLLTVNLVNRSSSSAVYATLSGRAIDQNNALILLQSDGQTPYLPSNPPAVQSRLAKNVAIRLGGPGSTTTVRIPHIAGGRIYFSINQPLTFFLNPGPALVEPSVTNPSDPNINLHWTFCEFTYNPAQLYANISYVDFVSSIPLALNLSTRSNQNLSVGGLKANGLSQVATSLQQQQSRDGKPWGNLIVRTAQGQNLRVLSPNLGQVGNPHLFAGYFEPYVDQVYLRYANQSLFIDTQAGFGTVSATTAGSTLNVTSASTSSPAGKATVLHPFNKPSTSDILTCSTGPFATGSNPEINAIIPRLAAAFNRSTLLKTDRAPAPQSTYYQENITNHYSRVVHEANVDGRGYAFPYDDVAPNGGRDESGSVFAGDPSVWTITLSGGPW